MASTSTSNKWIANHKTTMYDHDPANSTVATDIAWVDMRDYEGITIFVFTSLLGGNGPTVFDIRANSDSDGGGTDAVVKAHAVGDAPDAVGDWLVLEVTAEQIREVETSDTGELRYVSAQVTCQHTGDEAVVTYVRWGARHPRNGLTADTVA